MKHICAINIKSTSLKASTMQQIVSLSPYAMIYTIFPYVITYDMGPPTRQVPLAVVYLSLSDDV